MTYNAVLVSGEQSESDIYIFINIFINMNMFIFIDIWLAEKFVIYITYMTG